jgi:hypothetical protein
VSALRQRQALCLRIMTPIGKVALLLLIAIPILPFMSHNPPPDDAFLPLFIWFVVGFGILPTTYRDTIEELQTSLVPTNSG